MLDAPKAADFIVDNAKKCVMCGQCRSVCPVFSQMRTEGFSPRSRVFLADLVHRTCRKSKGGPAITAPDPVRCDKGELLDAAWNRMLSCLQCQACSADCPSGVPVSDILVAARREYVENRGKPDAIEAFARTIRETRNIAGDPNDKRHLCLEDLNLEDDRPRAGTPAQSSTELVYFVGCVSSLYPGAHKIPQAISRIMRHAGLRFTVLGGEEWCCGHPLKLLGLEREAEELARHNLESIRSLGVRRIMTSCPSCYWTWKHLGEQTGDELEVVHYTELLHEVVLERGPKLRNLGIVATYHDPCDLGRKCGIYDPPREILARIPGVVLREMSTSRKNARCCGGGGNLEMNDPALSARISDSRLAEAVATGAEVVVTACQQCVRSLSGAILRRQSGPRGIAVRDLAEIVWEAVRPE